MMTTTKSRDREGVCDALGVALPLSYVCKHERAADKSTTGDPLLVLNSQHAIWFSHTQLSGSDLDG